MRSNSPLAPAALSGYPLSPCPSPSRFLLAAAPGLEPLLRDEAADLGLPEPRPVPGGVTLIGGWPEVWQAEPPPPRRHPRPRPHRVLPRPAPRPARQARPQSSLGRDIARGRSRSHRGDDPRLAHLPCRRRPRPDRRGDPRRARSAGAGGGRRGCGDAPGPHRRRPLHDLGRHLGRAAAPPGAQAGGERRADAREPRRALPARRRLCRGEPVLDPMCGSGTFVDRGGRDRGRPRPRPVAELRLRAARRASIPPPGPRSGPGRGRGRRRSASTAATATPGPSP